MSGPGPDTPGTGADLLLRAADRIRTLYADVPYGTWTAGPKDPRPNFDLRVDGRFVAELNWGSESFTLPELLATLLGAAEPLAVVLDNLAAGFASKFPALVAPEVYALARAVLREGES